MVLTKHMPANSSDQREFSLYLVFFSSYKTQRTFSRPSPPQKNQFLDLKFVETFYIFSNEIK